MNNIDCEIIMDLLPLYADGMVSNDTGEIVESHLKECEECQEIYRQMTGKIDFSFEKKPMKKRKLKRKNILILIVLFYILLLLLINIAAIAYIGFI